MESQEQWTARNCGQTGTVDSKEKWTARTDRNSGQQRKVDSQEQYTARNSGQLKTEAILLPGGQSHMSILDSGHHILPATVTVINRRILDTFILVIADRWKVTHVDNT